MELNEKFVQTVFKPMHKLFIIYIYHDLFGDLVIHPWKALGKQIRCLPWNWDGKIILKVFQGHLH